MREIKFRAWDIENNEMLFFKFDELTRPGDKDGDFWDGYDGKRNASLNFINLEKNNTGYNHTDFNSRFDCELMQFTGLHDKNGKEIYEGDIMKLQYPLNYGYAGIHNKEILVTISFDSGCFWFTGDGYTDCNWHFYNEYEVIGNIYENPELLNK
jgi:uncharacterized phage protein (TIGR01671 family)